MNVADAVTESTAVTQTTAVTEAADGFANLVRELRAARSLSLSGLAARAGVGKATLSRWEAGKAAPRLAELDAVMDALGASEAQRKQALGGIAAPRAAARLHAAGVENEQPAGAGDLLRAMRQRRGHAADEVARSLGVSVQSVHAWERSDAWPSAERLHALCRLLGAAPAEVAALTAGNAWLSTLGSLPEADSPDALDALDAYLKALFFPPQGFDAEAEAVRDLSFLAILSRLSPLAGSRPAARGLLLLADSFYANWLSNQGRFREAGRRAERVMEQKPQSESQSRPWLRAALIRSHAAVYGGRYATAAAAVRDVSPLLEGVLPVAAHHPEMASWILSELAEFARLSGRPELALERAVRARDVAARVNETELALRRFDHARLLTRLGRPAEVLNALPPERATCHPPQRVSEWLLRAEALLQLGGVSEAHDWLSRAYAVIRQYGLDPHKADELAQRF